MSTRTGSTPDVLIVGGGIVGAACAYELSSTGRRVVVVDHSALPGAATAASAGMLAPMLEAGPNDPLLRAAVRARDLYPSLIATLQAATGIDIGLQMCGIHRVRFTEEEARESRAAVAWQRQHGYPTQWLAATEMQEALPGLGPEVVGAVFAPEDASLRPERLHAALLAGARMHGARIRRRDPATELMLRSGRVLGVRTRRAPARGIRAGAVVVAAGSWSGTLAGLPRALPVEPVRGQMVKYRWPRGVPPAVVFGTGGYVVHRDGTAIVGSTMEHVGFDDRVTDQGRAQLAAVAARIFPMLADQTPIDAWAGLRPMTPDGYPIIGADPDIQGLWYATGHGRNGVLLAALTGILVHEAMDGIPQDETTQFLEPHRLRV